VRGPRIVNNDFENKFGLDLALEDIRLGMEMAHQWNNVPKAMEVAFEYYKTASENGYGKEDCNAVYKIVK